MTEKCDKCDEHSGHRNELLNHKENIKELRDSLKTKVPRWVFIILVGVVLGNFGFQLKVLNIVTSIDKNVAVISGKLEAHTGAQEAIYETESEVKSCLVLAKNIWP